jgi:hypothetical protein
MKNLILKDPVQTMNTSFCAQLDINGVCPRKEYGRDKDILINMEEHHRSQHLNHTPPFNNTNTHTIQTGCK